MNPYVSSGPPSGGADPYRRYGRPFAKPLAPLLPTTAYDSLGRGGLVGHHVPSPGGLASPTALSSHGGGYGASGAPPPPSAPALHLRQTAAQLDRLQKENFDLKLRLSEFEDLFNAAADTMDLHGTHGDPSDAIDHAHRYADLHSDGERSAYAHGGGDGDGDGDGDDMAHGRAPAIAAGRHPHQHLDASISCYHLPTRLPDSGLDDDDAASDVARSDAGMRHPFSKPSGALPGARHAAEATTPTVNAWCQSDPYETESTTGSSDRGDLTHGEAVGDRIRGTPMPMPLPMPTPGPMASMGMASPLHPGEPHYGEPHHGALINDMPPVALRLARSPSRAPLHPPASPIARDSAATPSADAIASGLRLAAHPGSPELSHAPPMLPAGSLTPPPLMRRFRSATSSAGPHGPPSSLGGGSATALGMIASPPRATSPGGPAGPGWLQAVAQLATLRELQSALRAAQAHIGGLTAQRDAAIAGREHALAAAAAQADRAAALDAQLAALMARLNVPTRDMSAQTEAPPPPSPPEICIPSPRVAAARGRSPPLASSPRTGVVSVAALTHFWHERVMRPLSPPRKQLLDATARGSRSPSGSMVGGGHLGATRATALFTPRASPTGTPRTTTRQLPTRDM
ncbi:hypothetical protein CXG81DRAFT_18631 [Caulochytrium protostelioides]|uniref:Uncharacterized protein n=1 Tax=Caulochytrium protostelioides TaxID=1555241 RepID=A0A4V1IUS5_9FUNG|nr:hypothetical protein CXG81DRAFT_18631 [Caulochytrium protostelioides]|eukprot:RKP01579.1 hypothetical protein CXG81DRAFT_18631 [Caulochytrium protostelioides]